MKKKILIGVLLCLLSIFIITSGCKKTESETALVNECKSACKIALARGQNLNNGPCLLDPMSNRNWVCDIAHNPREAVDNLRENQCNAWHNRTASHFIELTPECELIKIV